MKKLNRFLLAEDPRHAGSLAIIHTIDPISIIGVIEGHKRVNDYFRFIEYTNTDGVEEKYTLYIHHLFTANMNNAGEQLAKQTMDKIINRAWHWYVSYMEWEDDNIDLNNFANEN